MTRTVRALTATLLLLLVPPARAAEPLPVLAAENMYGDVARQVGGSHVAVTSVLSNPGQDPHSFEASPSVARNLARARIVVLNGLGYDPWMEKLLRSVRPASGAASGRDTINVGQVAGRTPGDNPHIWYDLGAMRAYARALAERLGADDPANAADYARNLQAFEASLEPVAARVAALRTRLAGMPATATEPVFGYMFEALGMTVRNGAFQLAVMNDTEPAASAVAAFETDLRTRAVRLLVYNSQTSSPLAARMERLARASGIPVVGATETEPPGTTYQAWMSGALDAVERALPR